MQRILPGARPGELGDLYRGLTLPAGDGRPWVAIGMVASLDGAASIQGRTAALGGAADAMAFRRLRAAGDVILVGAGTVRDEGYGPAPGTRERRADRAGRGLAERVRIAIVSGSLDLPPDHRVFSDPASRPIVLTREQAPPDRARALAEVADVVAVGERAVDLRRGLEHLSSLGLRRVLCEGGPRLNGSLLEADLVDEAFVTVTPIAVGGSAPRITHSEVGLEARPFTIVSVWEHESELVVRYRRDRGSRGSVAARAEEAETVNPAIRKYLEAASSFTTMTTARAEKVARQLAKSGEAAGDQVGDLVDELMERQRRNQEAVTALVKSETSRAVKAMGMASTTEVEQLSKEVAELKRELARLRAERSGGAKKSTAKKSAGKKSAGKKSTAKKSAAKKSTAKKSAAKKSAGKKSTAKKSAAKKSTTATSPSDSSAS